MQTQIAERQELHQTIDMLPDDSVLAILKLIKSLKPSVKTQQDDGCSQHIPNAETRAAMAELQAGKGKKFSSIEVLMADLHDENDD